MGFLYFWAYSVLGPRTENGNHLKLFRRAFKLISNCDAITLKSYSPNGSATREIERAKE